MFDGVILKSFFVFGNGNGIRCCLGGFELMAENGWIKEWDFFF